jgi:hypothetical protein
MSAKLDDPVEQRLASWIEENLSCEVLSVERQQRWRPCWYVDTRTRDGATRPLYVRGERLIYAPETRREGWRENFIAEYEVNQRLEAENIPVPHVYGLCPDPLAIVTDRAPGRSDLSTTDSDNERAAVLGQYMEALAAIHAIDPVKFDGVAIPRPKARGDTALPLFDMFEKRYRAAKCRPEPDIEFMIGWVRRNQPQGRDKVSFNVCDTAQFMFDEGRLTALLDLELAYMGDSVQDLATLQLRNTSEPLGDIPRALRHYEEVTGQPIDGPVLDYHTIAFGVVTPMSMTENIARPVPTANVLQYFEWWILIGKLSMELMAAITGRALPAHEPLAAEPQPFGAMAHSLVTAIDTIPVEAGFAEYERSNTAKLGKFMARVGELGPCAQRRDQTDIEAMLGARFESRLAAEAALEAFVLQASPEDDDRLIPLIYRRLQRQWEIFTPFVSRPSLLEVDLKTYAQLMERAG